MLRSGANCQLLDRDCVAAPTSLCCEGSTRPACATTSPRTPLQTSGQLLNRSFHTPHRVGRPRHLPVGHKIRHPGCRRAMRQRGDAPGGPCRCSCDLGGGSADGRPAAPFTAWRPAARDKTASGCPLRDLVARSGAACRDVVAPAWIGSWVRQLVWHRSTRHRAAERCNTNRADVAGTTLGQVVRYACGPGPPGTQ